VDYVTIGKNYPEGKIVPVNCQRNDSLKDINIKDQCYLLIIVTEGNAVFRWKDHTLCATAPCFVCFDETDNPVLINKKKCKSISVYFHPQFLNLNMTFDLIRSNNYDDIANVHDMFLLKPFLCGCGIVPIGESYVERINTACIGMEYELSEQRDWYWTCRGRSYFMEIIIALERMYDIMQSDEITEANDIKNEKLKNAMLFIEGHYFYPITLSEISKGAGINHTTLTAMFRKELDMTAIEYLMYHRVKVAKKKLSFTFVPIKDISAQCGFKTVQHFSRVFKKITGETPADYRNRTFEKRVTELG